jgi:RimJ/RimL family protein N-acetyltransferase
VVAQVVTLRPPTLADAAEWLAGEDDEIARWFEWARRSTLDDVTRAMQSWTESWQTGGPVRCWAIIDVATNAIAGGVELHRLDANDVNLSYWVFAPWRRRGIATRACELALDYAANEMRASRAVIKVLEGNAASLAVVRRLAAQPAGTTPSDGGETFLVFHRALEPMSRRD